MDMTRVLHNSDIGRTRPARYRDAQFALVALFLVLIPSLICAVVVRTFEAASTQVITSEISEISTLHAGVAALRSNETALAQYVADRVAHEPTLTAMTLFVREDAEYRPLVGSAVAVDHTMPASDLTDTTRATPGVTRVYPTHDDPAQWVALRSLPSDAGAELLIRSVHVDPVPRGIFTHSMQAVAALLLLTLTALIFFALLLRQELRVAAKVRDREAAISESDAMSETIAHELRAPLTALRGYASLIAEAPDRPDEVRTHAERITAATSRLVSVVSQFVTITRLRSGRERIDVSELDVVKLCAEVADDATPTEGTRSVALQTQLPDHRVAMRTDPARLSQILTILLRIALMRTGAGTITLSLFRTPQTVTIRVSDDRRTLPTDTDQDGPQMALELWIVKQFIELLGGTFARDVRENATTMVATFPRELSNGLVVGNSV